MEYHSRLQSKLNDELFDAILSLRSREECYRFFEDLCSVSELQAMAQRLEVARMLAEDITYIDIARLTGASTATISRINRCLKYGAEGYRIALERSGTDGSPADKRLIRQPFSFSARAGKSDAFARKCARYFSHCAGSSTAASICSRYADIFCATASRFSLDINSMSGFSAKHFARCSSRSSNTISDIALPLPGQRAVISLRI